MIDANQFPMDRETPLPLPLAPETDETPDLSILEHDAAQVARLTQWQELGYVTAGSPDTDEVAWLTNTPRESLSPILEVYKQLKDMGYDVRFFDNATSQGGQRLSRLLAVYVGHEDKPNVQRIQNLTYQKRKREIPYGAFVDALFTDSSDLFMVYLRPRPQGSSRTFQAVVADMFPAGVKGMETVSQAAKEGLYVRACMNRLLRTYIREQALSDDDKVNIPSAEAILRADYALYAKLRAMGIPYLGPEEIGGLVSRWLYDVRQTEGIPGPASKRQQAPEDPEDF